MLALGVGNAWGAGSYVKVTTAPSDWSGDYLIVYESGKQAFNGALTTLDAVSNTVSVTISNNQIAATDAMNKAKFTINASGHIKSASGYYIGQTSNANGLKSNKTTNYTNTLTINNDASVNIVSGGAYLRYNATSGQTRFRYYKSSSYSSQKAIHLYKYVEEQGGGDEETVPSLTEEQFSWSAAAASATLPDQFDEKPTLINTEDLAVTYSTSNDKVATIDVNGNVILIGVGTADIKATAGDGVTFEETTVSYTLTVKPAPLVIEPIEGGVIDILTHETFGVTSNSYTSFSGKQATNDNHSDAVYAGKTARNGNATQYNIQLNLLKDGRQFATTTSGGLAKRVYVKWATQTANVDARTLDIYGSNTAYTGSETSTSTTKIGAIKYTTGAAEAYVDLTGDYKYILMTGSGAIYMDEIQVTWVVAEGTVTTPTISGADEFIESTEVTISAEDGLKVYYTLDGTDPTNASTEYTAPFELTATTTVKAVAYDGEKASDIISKTFKQLHVLTCEEAAELCADTESADKYVVRGYVTELVDGGYNATYNNTTLWMADTKNGGQVLQAFRLIPVSNIEKTLVVGDYVEVIGSLVLWSGTKEIKNGSIEKIPAPIVNHTITVSANPAEAGTVTGGGEYEETDEITVKAVATEGYEFVNWTEGEEVVSTDAEYTFEVLADRALVANFEKLTYTVTATAENGTVTGAGEYTHGAEVALTATPAEHYVFVNWTAGETVLSTENPYIFTLEAAVELKANFALDTHTITATVTAENGTVTGAGEYTHGTEVTLTATANEHYVFVNWTAGETVHSTENPYIFTLEKDVELTANFALDTHTVTATATNGTVEGTGTYEHGATATLTATPAEGYEFVNWTAGETVVSTENPYTFTVTADVALVANFKEKVVAPAELYLTPNANWKKDNARFAAYFFGNGEKWVSMTKVAGETGLYEVTIPTDKKYPNVIFCRMNPSATANNWNNKWNQTADLTIPTDGKNHYTVKENTWDKGGGTWSIWPVPAEKNYVDVTITITATASASIKWSNAGDKLADATEYVAMTAGENNTYTYTLAQVEEAKGVDYTIKVGDIVSTTKNTSKNVTVDFKNLLPQVAIEGIDGKWDSSNKMTVSDDYLTASITLPLAAKDHAWKLTIDAAWLGGSKFVITRTNNSVVVKEDAGGDGKLTADIAGDYVFTWTYASQTLTVAYPVSVTATAENGTVEGAGTYTHGTEVTLTATPAEGYEFVNWTVGEETITENPYKFTVTADVALVANFTPTLPTEIKISGEATHTEYNFGEQFDVTGLVVTAVYSDKEIDITEQVEWTMSPLTIGTTAVEVKATYATFSATKTCNVTVHVPHNKVTTADVLNGIFLVSDTKAVKFSTGNLQYNCGTYTWSFAEKQYEIIGGEAYDGTNNTNYGMNVPGYTGKLDLFAWSCESSKYGVNPSNTDADYTGAFVDWGTLVEETGWYTLTQAEMQYLLNQKKDGKALWTFASIEGIKGLMLMPYNWDVKQNDDIEYGYAPKDFSAEFEHNVFTADEWEGFQGPGAAFLPTAGSRTGGYGNTENAGVSNEYDENGHYFHVDNVNDYGYYWLNTEDSRDGYQHCASYLIFPGWSDNELKDDESDDSNYGPTIWSREKRRGNSVRLVKETTRPDDATTDILNLETGIAPQKIFMNGQLIIIKNGVTYNAQGQVVK